MAQMGGTSTDVALVADGKPALRRETVVDKLTVRAPSVDVKTVGAGGGSIARFTPISNSMRVGPESAGASPGPACYRTGGTAPTVTDAHLILGYLPDKLLGGDFQLHLDAATTAVKCVADQMGISVEETAVGIVDLANETMYGALRQVAVEQGYDPRDFARKQYPLFLLPILARIPSVTLCIRRVGPRMPRKSLYGRLF